MQIGWGLLGSCNPSTLCCFPLSSVLNMIGKEDLPRTSLQMISLAMSIKERASPHHAPRMPPPYRCRKFVAWGPLFHACTSPEGLKDARAYSLGSLTSDKPGPAGAPPVTPGSGGPVSWARAGRALKHVVSWQKALRIKHSTPKF